MTEYIRLPKIFIISFIIYIFFISSIYISRKDKSCIKILFILKKKKDRDHDSEILG